MSEAGLGEMRRVEREDNTIIHGAAVVTGDMISRVGARDGDESSESVPIL